MNRGIVYYNRGTKCLIRLAVNLYSLRRSGYAGNVCLLYEDKPAKWFMDVLSIHNIDTRIIPTTTGNPLATKPSLWRYSPYETSLYLDTDMLVIENPEPLFPLIEARGFAVTRFADWRSNGPRIQKRIEQWRGVVPEMINDAVKHGPAVNTGVFGWTKNHSILTEWERITKSAVLIAGDEAPMGRVLDEIACQILVAAHPYTLLDQRWNHSVNHGIGDKPGILHFHGGKHVMKDNGWCDLWKVSYWELRLKYGPEIHAALGEPEGDRRLNCHLYTGNNRTGPAQVRKDLTVVTAADTNYAKKLTGNFIEWMKLPGLREQSFLVFTLDSDPLDKAYDGLRAFANIRLVTWASKAETIRERAFSAFVFGVAKHVKTDYWLKLDADARVVGSLFEWPEYKKYSIVGSHCGYTRTKPHAERAKGKHFLNRLDEWWGDIPMFPGTIDPSARHRHHRLKSFAWIEKTDFTRRLAAKCGGKLPILSQDTTAWYVATRWKEPMASHGFRKFITA